MGCPGGAHAVCRSDNTLSSLFCDRAEPAGTCQSYRFVPN